jgi:hypothetical protein
MHLPNECFFFSHRKEGEEEEERMFLFSILLERVSPKEAKRHC